jgi:hypothetical protein
MFHHFYRDQDQFQGWINVFAWFFMYGLKICDYQYGLGYLIDDINLYKGAP